MSQLTRMLAAAALRRQNRHDVPGRPADVEEVEALSAYMKMKYVCPTLTRRPELAN